MPLVKFNPSQTSIFANFDQLSCIFGAFQQVRPLLTRLLTTIAFLPKSLPSRSYFVLAHACLSSLIHPKQVFSPISTSKVVFSGLRPEETMALQQVWPSLTRFKDLLSTIIFPPKCSYFVLTCLLVKFNPSQTASNKYF